MELEVVVPQDITEQILVRADVKALTRFKSVCKSWQTLISEDRFVKAHLNNSYNNDRKIKKMGHRRIVVSRDSMPWSVQRRYSITNECNLLGSSNGLVCISTSYGQVLVANPLTRDVKKLPSPNILKILEWSTCWGFGYDASTDDYKVIVGSFSDFGWMSFQVLSLKTNLNIWKDVGKLKCFNLHKVGILFNGKLHWFMQNQNKDIILSFDLSEEIFEEIAQPGEFKYQRCCYLGIYEECLCICELHHKPIWVMKNYNVRESWVSLQYPLQNDNDVVHYMRPIKDSLSHTSFFTNNELIMSSSRYVNYYDDPIFVRSLVSPHVNG